MLFNMFIFQASSCWLSVHLSIYHFFVLNISRAKWHEDDLLGNTQLAPQPSLLYWKHRKTRAHSNYGTLFASIRYKRQFARLFAHTNLTNSYKKTAPFDKIMLFLSSTCRSCQYVIKRLFSDIFLILDKYFSI